MTTLRSTLRDLRDLAGRWPPPARTERKPLLDRVFGPRCTVTGDRVFPADRRAHEGTEHPTDGPCDG